ncbi:YggS family pyridoxal phosphate-dependent enzyme [Verrucomicrobiaceae bacterium N1E253]|uniref:Pyridoxal phosphate homeostasis protein n=1 Tax=Oceaniferula marina TaxID=2748318 RepID=A0A851GIG7_9BACT|nr:YggS family pyridoxal phosphate-dependent enzyme [Oceaniferula marina]NWK57146.1 YggS family pyridoxal phosphate-dependent enzyme [Oceaniferula marina]
MSGVIAENLAKVKQQLAEALIRSGRGEDDCELLVVSKTWPAEVVAEVIDAGHRAFGENKVQEGMEKIPSLPQGVRWHLIGHLQRNKVRKALPLFGTLHGIDSLKLARYTSNLAVELGCHPDVYLQVNLAGEERKSGFSPDDLRRELEELDGLDGLNVLGLMCIPPAVACPEDARPWFARLRELRDELESTSGLSLPGLSMGMSGDYEAAIEEGSTIVRVGSAIFGARNYAV